MDEFLFDPEQSAMEQGDSVAVPRKITPNGDVILPPSGAVSAPAQAVPAPRTVVQTAPGHSGTAAPAKRRNGLWLVLTIMALCISLTLSAFALAEARNGTVSPAKVYGITQSNTPSTNVRTDVKNGDAMTTPEIIAKLNPSVVTVLVDIYDSQTQQSGSGFGTGIVFSENGYILTNAHVVSNARKVTVRDNNGQEYTATVIGYDTPSDVAVIKADATGMQPAEFGQSAQLIPGDKVIAIGTPYDEALAHTATEGIVSALRKNMHFPELGYTLNVIQHSAPINMGNSGGPLVNEYGQVVGINSIKISGSFENIGFALPIDEVIPLAEELMEKGKIERPAIGITGYTYEDEDLQGTYVYSVIEGGPAEAAGLQVGDVIFEADGTRITSIDELKEIINAHKIGDELSLRYYRDGTVHNTTVTLKDLG